MLVTPNAAFAGRAGGVPPREDRRAGSEGAALEGRAGLLARSRVKVLVEFWPAGLARSGYGAERLRRRLGFRAYEIDEVECCVRRADPLRLLERYPVASEEGFSYLLCVKALPGR
jgi:hypothetical protein